MQSKKLLLSLLLIYILPAFNTLAQSKIIDDIRLNRNYDLSIYGKNNIALLYTSKKIAGDANFQLIQLDRRLKLIDSTSIILGGNYQLIASETNETATLSVFYEKDLIRTIYMVTRDGINHMLHSDGLFYHPRKFKTLIRAGEDLETFYVVKQTLTNNTYHLLKLNLEEGLIWETRLQGRKKNGSDIRIEDAFHLGDKVAVVQGDNARSRKVNFSIEFYDSSSGSKVSSTQVNSEDIVKSIDLIKIDKASNRLLMAGRYQPGNRLKQQQTISFYLAEYDLHGDLIHQQVGFGPEIDNFLVAWQDIIFDEEGNLKLIGERFTSTSDGEKIAMGVFTTLLTGGLLTAYTGTMKAREIILIDFDQQLNLTDTQIVPFQKTVLVNPAVDEYRTLDFARRIGLFRYRGVLENQYGIFAIGDVFAIVDLMKGTVNQKIFKAPENTEFLSFLKDWKYPVHWDNEGAVFYKKLPSHQLYFEYKNYSDLERFYVKMKF